MPAVRLVFMGSAAFAVPTLEAIATRRIADIVAVYTVPDAPSRRGRACYPSPVRAVAEELDLVVRTPATLRDEAEIEHLRELALDLIVVVAYGQILPRAVLDIPRFGCINVHASLLPRWRGAAPIQRAMLARDARIGVSLMRMEEGLDTGDWCAQADLALTGDESFEAISSELARMGALLLVEQFDAIVSGTAIWHTQDEALATYAHKIDKTVMALDPLLSARELFDRIRVSSDSAPARISISGKEVRIQAAELLAPSELSDGSASNAPVRIAQEPGQVRFVDRTVFLSGRDPQDGLLKLLEVKPAGGRAMTAEQWAHGAHLPKDTAWA